MYISMKMDFCFSKQGIFCPSLGAQFRPHSQSKIATFFPKVKRDHYYNMRNNDPYQNDKNTCA